MLSKRTKVFVSRQLKASLKENELVRLSEVLNMHCLFLSDWQEVSDRKILAFDLATRGGVDHRHQMLAASTARSAYSGKLYSRNKYTLFAVST
jgi:hypothetical protein